MTTAATFEGVEPADRRAALRRAVRLYFGEMARHKRVAIPALLLPAIGNIALLYVPPLIVAHLAGSLIRNDHGSAFSHLLGYIGIFAVSMAVGELLWRIGMHCINRTDGYGIEDLYVLGMDELLAKDAAFFHDNFAGSLTKRLVSFAARYEEFVDTLAFSVVANLVPLLFACVVLWHYSGWLVAVLLGLIVMTGGVVMPLVQRRQRLVDEREAAWARVSGNVADTLGNIEAVRSFAAEDRESVEHRRRVANQRRLAIRSWDYGNLHIDTLVASISIATNTLGLLVVISLADIRNVETIIVAFSYYLQATRVLFEFNRTYRHFETALTDAAQFTALLLDPPTVVDPDPAEPLAPRDASVRFDDVWFTYPGAAPLFRGLKVEVADGERVGLVGRSGGGKTSLTKLLLRHMDVDGGRILVGGQDVSRLRQADLRSLVSYVPQDPIMFHRSLRENIAFGRPDASDRDVREAADAAHVMDFVTALPDGLDTLVGERGVKLSGGQRQRIALARAILRNAPILVLDEATSALDSESEALIQDALWRLMAGRTALVVAHRLSTVARMDRLIVIDQGAVVETGTHRQLLDGAGLYAELWARQSGGFLGESGSPPMTLTLAAHAGLEPATASRGVNRDAATHAGNS